MSEFSVELSQPAASYFRRLGKDVQRRIVAKLEELRIDYAAHSKRLVNQGGARSARVGDLRVLFDVNEELRKLEVTAILPRGDVYKHHRR